MKRTFITSNKVEYIDIFSSSHPKFSKHLAFRRVLDRLDDYLQTKKPQELRKVMTSYRIGEDPVKYFVGNFDTKHYLIISLDESIDTLGNPV